MQLRCTVVGLLFGIEQPILEVLRTCKDVHMLLAAATSLHTMYSIEPFDDRRSAAVVESIQKIDGPGCREDCKEHEEIMQVWMQCEATYIGMLGQLLKGEAVLADRCSTVVQVVQEIREIVEHATSVEVVTAKEYHADLLHNSLWCLRVMFDGASTLGEWKEDILIATWHANKFLNYLPHLRSARD